ncbi:hypothetical protein ES703_116547 [subsurface metagenome]
MVEGIVTISASPTSAKLGSIITFTGRVLIDGAPIPGLYVGIYLDAAPAEPVFLTSGENDANGYYNIQWTSNYLGNLPIYALAAALEGFYSPTIIVKITEEEPAEVPWLALIALPFALGVLTVGLCTAPIGRV